MNTIKKQMIEINQLCNESDEIYHNIAQSYGLTDSIYWILYILYNYDEPVSQVDLCNSWFYSKQTVNTSIAALLKREWITLEVIPNTQVTESALCLQKTGSSSVKKQSGKHRKLNRRLFPESQGKKGSFLFQFSVSSTSLCRKNTKRNISEQVKGDTYI